MNEAQYLSLFNKLSNIQEDLAELRAYVASREILQRNEILSLVNERTVARNQLEELRRKYQDLKEKNHDQSI